MGKKLRNNIDIENNVPFFLKLWGTVFGVGYVPIAPATAVSLGLCFLIWFLPESLLPYLIVLLVLFPFGVWISSRLEDYWGIDDRKIVIDECIGIIITLLAIPHRIIFFLLGFLFFRFFDIVKPPPIKISQNLRKGWGVVMDDVIAGMYSSVLLWIFIFVYRAFSSL
jgi:phosphatidylglycerophosphatase A